MRLSFGAAPAPAPLANHRLFSARRSSAGGFSISRVAGPGACAGSARCLVRKSGGLGDRAPQHYINQSNRKSISLALQEIQAREQRDDADCKS